MTDILHVDTETFSTIDLRKCGLYHYAEAVEIMMVSWALNDEPVRLWDITQGDPPKDLLEMLVDTNIQKWAHHAPFERRVFNSAWGIDTNPKYWRCTAVLAASLGLPRSLADVGAAIGLPSDRQKMAVGGSLIRYFCLPCKPTKKNGGRTRNLPEHDPAKWKLFGDYCIRDTDVERDVHHKLSKFPMLESEWELWELDQQINDRGLLVDRDLVQAAIDLDAISTGELLDEAMRITGLTNPNSVKQLREWLLSEEELDTENLDKKTVKTLLNEGDDLSDSARRVLEIRQQMSKSSVKKFAALDRWTCSDDRIRGIFLFNGAARTQRWSGQGFQPQNLARGTIEDGEDLSVLRDLVKRRDIASVEALYG